MKKKLSKLRPSYKIFVFKCAGITVYGAFSVPTRATETDEVILFQNAHNRLLSAIKSEHFRVILE